MNSDAELGRCIAEMTTDLKLEFNTAQHAQLRDYLLMLVKWNRVYNLTAIRSIEKMLSHHLADSLSLVPYLGATRVLDVGTGAGFPGIPLAIALPRTQFTLIDTVSKKTRFLQQVVGVLQLKNVRVINQRVENYNTEERFDVIMARAFARCEKIIKLTQHLVLESGVYLLQKGVYPSEELKQVSRPYEVEAIKVPGLDAERHLVIIKNGDNHG